MNKETITVGEVKDMNVLSLYDGMSCGMLAMLKAGIKVDNYYAYEIDKYAIQTSQHNFPKIKQCGDVFEGDYKQYKGVDYLIGGSPCQRWSIAQSPDKRETTASGIGWELFSQYVRALHEAEPKFFIYENNKSMSAAIRQSITETFGFEPICINSALVSAQNRQRLYWVGKRNADGTYSKVDVPQPQDRGILLRDVLDNPVNTANDGKSQTLKVQYSNTDVNNICCYKSTYGASGVAEPVCVASRGRYSDTDSRSSKTDAPTYQHYEARTDGKTTTLCAEGGGMGAKTGLYAMPIEFSDLIIRKNAHVAVNDNAIRGVQDKNNASCAESFYEFTDTKANTLTTAHRPKIIDKLSNYTYLAEACEWNKSGEPTKVLSYTDGKKYAVYTVKDGQITIKEKQYPIKLVDGYYIIRKLTVSECKRLQTVPEWYEFPVSDTQAYKMLGNGWTVDVIAHLINATEST